MATIGIRTDAGILEAAVPRDRLTVPNPHQLLVLMILVALLLTAVAIVFLRNQVRPIRALAEAAEAFGKGRALAFRPAGAEEVRRAGAAFLSMRTRLERQIEQRTQMLSGVSHDLRTPLTRMKLTLALMDDSEETRDLAQDVDQMERMLGAFLAFARGDGLEETVPTDPFALAEEIADDARRTGAAIRVVAVDESERGAVQPALVPLRPGAVARAVQNLVGNAAEHGRSVLLTVRLGARALTCVVEDDGPGIPEADRARALQPFTRLDAARRSNPAGNVGLGLSIALDVARSHGGSLELRGKRRARRAQGDPAHSPVRAPASPAREAVAALRRRPRPRAAAVLGAGAADAEAVGTQVDRQRAVAAQPVAPDEEAAAARARSRQFGAISDRRRGAVGRRPSAASLAPT